MDLQVDPAIFTETASVSRSSSLLDSSNALADLERVHKQSTSNEGEWRWDRARNLIFVLQLCSRIC